MVLFTGHAARSPALFIREEPASPEWRKPTVYLDTTIPSYLTAALSRDITKARMQRITRVWWSRFRPTCEIFISELVIAESRDGREESARKRLAALESIEAVRLSERSESLVESLLEDGLILKKARADAEHLAYAATNSVRFLLTWNCKHLANRMIFRRVIERCESRGLRCPQICTPETMMRIYSHERRTY
jgi:predicted nucleic acid-binding protein